MSLRDKRATYADHRHADIRLYLARELEDYAPMPLRIPPAFLLSGVASVCAIAQPAEHAHGPTTASSGVVTTAVPLVAVDGQPLAANVQRVAEAFDYLGAAFPAELRAELSKAGQARDAQRLQQLLDSRVLLAVHINPEVRVKVGRGPAAAALQQAGYTPVLVKVMNESGGTQRLRIGSPQSGPVYAGMSKLAGERMQQPHLRENENITGRTDRFLEVEMYSAPPMTAQLSGLEVEYAIALLYSAEAGRREATLTFDVGQGTQDLGFRAELPVLFEIRPAVAVKLNVQDHDGTLTMGRFQFVDSQGHVFPPQAKRFAPDLFFQKHIYRADGETVFLPPGQFTMSYGRGPEYRWIERRVTIPATTPRESGRGPEISVKLERWVDPAARGFFSGDHHIHASGCAHYTVPSEGVEPVVMFRQVKGEALNVGSVLTWGPGFDHQQGFFATKVHALSEPMTQFKYDIEVSGFGSQALGHVCLLNLKEQIYPGASGSKNWPSWTLPVLRWTKAQGGVTGYAHSGSGLQIEPLLAARRLLAQLDANRDGQLDAGEAGRGLLPEPLTMTDSNHNGLISETELTASHDRVADQLPNLAIPELNSVGAQEIFVTAALGACDFISAMDTARVREWNAWYHLLNCGLPVKASGETDFPCMSGTRVGQGRSYVQLGKRDGFDYVKWCEGIARGRSYVSDGYAHALEFTVNGTPAGDEVRLGAAGDVTVRAEVAFSPETPLEVMYGGAMPVGGRRYVGDTVVMYETQAIDRAYQRGERRVEIVVNGTVVASRDVPADGHEHAIEFKIPIERSSWIAVRQFPQLHTNPVNVIVAGKPIRAWRASAEWALGCIDQLWRIRGSRIAASERDQAAKAYEQARAFYRRVIDETPAGQ
ncbi:MAG: CehA/McbA family metallohydrolase [Opitutaceae bacterium]|nr:CehA/McbA family metallohydrolase [Opitutaceae bacterium]